TGRHDACDPLIPNALQVQLLRRGSPVKLGKAGTTAEGCQQAPNEIDRPVRAGLVVFTRDNRNLSRCFRELAAAKGYSLRPGSRARAWSRALPTQLAGCTERPCPHALEKVSR